MLILKRLIIFLIFTTMLFSAWTVWAATPSEYLKYQEPSQPAASSAFSTFAYVISLVLTFMVVIGLAYATSKYLGQRMGKLNSSGDNRIIYTLPLGANKAVYMVEVAGKFLVLGVTEHTINLLNEVTSPEEIEKLKALTPLSQPMSPFEQVFERQLSSLHHMSKKFPTVFKHANQDDIEGKR